MDLRAAEERRLGAIQALRAMVECLAETNPQAIFASDSEELALDGHTYQAITNRWASQGAEVLGSALKLANLIGEDAAAMFAEVGRAEVS